mmetsp:Transcript_33858/g.79148  ORF Transcript_33858/g.79148 Transcript_33858/m.79148 type:complete len:227 (+) Transcript_33858:1829-2509(+)
MPQSDHCSCGAIFDGETHPPCQVDTEIKNGRPIGRDGHQLPHWPKVQHPDCRHVLEREGGTFGVCWGLRARLGRKPALAPANRGPIRLLQARIVRLAIVDVIVCDGALSSCPAAAGQHLLPLSTCRLQHQCSFDRRGPRLEVPIPASTKGEADGVLALPQQTRHLIARHKQPLVPLRPRRLQDRRLVRLLAVDPNFAVACSSEADGRSCRHRAEVELRAEEHALVR